MHLPHMGSSSNGISAHRLSSSSGFRAPQPYFAICLFFLLVMVGRSLWFVCSMRSKKNILVLAYTFMVNPRTVLFAWVELAKGGQGHTIETLEEHVVGLVGFRV